MKSIIEDFYYGEIVPAAHPAPNSKKYKETMSLFHKKEEEFLDKYPESKNMLDEYKDILRQISVMEAVSDFVQGFRLGAAFMSDVLDDI